MSVPEIETTASRVLYINSKDATTKYGNFDTDFDFSLEEPISVPHNHIILLSLYSAEIPFSFYQFDTGINTRIVIQVTNFGTPASYSAAGLFDEDPATNGNAKVILIPEGNYNAIQLANELTNTLGDTTNDPNVFPVKVTFNVITLKFEFVCTTPGKRLTIGISNVNPFFIVGAPLQGNMNEELGFIVRHDLPSLDGDLFVELNGAGNSWNSGYTTNPGIGIAGPGIDTATTGAPFSVATPLSSPNVADLTASCKSLFVRTNLSTSSVMDSHIGGGFSNILARVPVNVAAGGMIRVDPINGNVHKLMIRSKSITNVSIRLTNQRNVPVDLNGLNFDISLKLDFINETSIPDQPEFREIWGQGAIVDERDQEPLEIRPNPRPDRIPVRPTREQEQAEQKVKTKTKEKKKKNKK